MKQNLQPYRKNKNERPQSNFNEGLRAAFKQSLAKLNQISTRQPAMKELKSIIIKNKTTNNLRVWLSVLSENRDKHVQSQIMVLWFIIQQYDKGLLDPLDKIPSLQKTVFRVTQLLIKYFSQQHQNVALACQKAWLQLYLSTLQGQQTQTKKKLLYDNLQAIIIGGGGKITQLTAQLVVYGLLQTSVSKEDHQFFKEIAKRTLMLFLKTTIYHPSTLMALQTILSYFSINNLIPLLDTIVTKILMYISTGQPNSLGYKIKAQACNCLDLIGQQIDKNGVPVYERIIKILEDLATDKVWAVQVTGRKAVSTWRKKKRLWDSEFNAKNQRLVDQIEPIDEISENYQAKDEELRVKNRQKSPKYKTHNNWYNSGEVRQKSKKKNRVSPTTQDNFYQNHKYLHKNTGNGGGNNVQSVENYYERIKPVETYSKKMEEIKKSIYQGDQIDFEDTVPWEQSKSLPSLHNIQSKTSPEFRNTQNLNGQKGDKQFLNQWQHIVSLADQSRFQQASIQLIIMDDDIYFLRFILKYGIDNNFLQSLTRPTSSKIVKKMLQIKNTNFMQQLLLTMVGESSKYNMGRFLPNYHNIMILKNLQEIKKMTGLQKISERLQTVYENSLRE